MNRRTSSGFTLIELMVVVAIVAIVAAIAIPAFTEQMRKSRRAEAMQGLSEMQLQQERWRTNNAQYATTAQLNLPTSDFYTFAVASQSATGYSMTATITAGTAQVGDRCGTFTLNNVAGVIEKKVSTGLTDCW